LHFQCEPPYLHLPIRGERAGERQSLQFAAEKKNIGFHTNRILEKLRRVLAEGTARESEYFGDGCHLNPVGVDALTIMFKELMELFDLDVVLTDSTCCSAQVGNWTEWVERDGSITWYRPEHRDKRGRRLRAAHPNCGVWPCWGASFQVTPKRPTCAYYRELAKAISRNHLLRTVCVFAAGNDCASSTPCDVLAGIEQCRRLCNEAGVKLLLVEGIPGLHQYA
jgi:hypothetical protein